MSQYLLDTNICVYLTKNEFDLVAKLRQVGYANCFLSEITIAEMLYGVANSAPTKQTANRQSVQHLQQAFAGRILPITNCLEVYAQQKAHLKRIGRLQGEFDMLIGSTALAHGLALVTRNTRHFTELSGIQLKNWIDEPAHL
ncbi:type II toxin-antitoxin system VapC family toxin [Hymenobacter cellulosilyticus]|uniref:Ribonuclease VapC n=1 Tax=Hymenobacter cellulosilyticus TaxID=2932248 RepID=A0A8T9QA52_9BACT|nr:type II toxin-antitoxin system VapC family toxin [Hymenobacter cellulosilyticus]UOQ74025.1 type II toxin-antitoxin system VapC family toxin [Hymenobacter cellulosilyticus]